jgi:hypothetical protein
MNSGVTPQVLWSKSQPAATIRGAAILKKHKFLTNVHGDAEKRYRGLQKSYFNAG